ncbi:AbrB/MazE/SpoVT family DNA-binding domain-containing protein [Chroococcidiopsis thermalis]|uniref:Transcriptional regulator, AbrB family n=1 Tax=Chroococcidiopsis thermalis (strain PCC 7203) TaxID=251229 RepID=K9U9F5_CHRTP|nr:AbrB/MazE/SpoVT family DNA-binding domain-containing protein [Chroococcidiopsis thermalis]AFY91233.1 transcriptional regulator, AbrB family [Chroococcidiopsis thermalis PCC 7203]
MELLTVDASGRVLIPKKVREQLGINTQAQLSLEIEEGRIILQPISKEAETYYEEGVLVVKTEPIENLETIIDELREERINEFTS